MSGVVDASVMGNVFLSEDKGPAAFAAIAGRELCAPVLLRLEFAQMLVRQRRGGLLTRNDAERVLATFHRLPITYHDHEPLLGEAFHIADVHGVTMYDGVYLALALREDRLIVTSDRRQYDVALALGLVGEFV